MHRADPNDLRTLTVRPVIPVSDLHRSLAFYEEALGLDGRPVPGGYEVRCGGETAIYLLTETGYAGRAEWPLASFCTPRIEETVAELRRRGVHFEAFAEGPQQTDDLGIADLDRLRIAWVRDPGGQVLSIFQPA